MAEAGGLGHLAVRALESLDRPAALFHHFALLEARHRPILERLRCLTREVLFAGSGQRTDGVATHLETLLGQAPALDEAQADALAIRVWVTSVLRSAESDAVDGRLCGRFRTICKGSATLGTSR